jgi:hypothetical protein
MANIDKAKKTELKKMIKEKIKGKDKEIDTLIDDDTKTRHELAEGIRGLYGAL